MENRSTALSEDLAAPSLQPFAQAAPLYAAMGLTPIPVDGDKKPLVCNWEKFWPGTHSQMVERFADANVACLSGRTPFPLTVVDIDDPTDADWCEETFGDTSVRVRTPKGGQHWYFRGNGETRSIRFAEGREVDLLGKGGYQVMPPSRTELGDYTFIEDDFGSLSDLPTICGEVRRNVGSMVEGDGRNKELFQQLLRAAPNAETFEELVFIGEAYNEQFREPLPAREVRWAAKNPWRYKVEGRLMLPGSEAKVQLSSRELDAFWNNGRGDKGALWLYVALRRSKWSYGTRPFVLPTEYGRKVAGFGCKRTYRRARDFLFRSGLLIQVQAGSSGSRQATIVRFAYGGGSI